VIAKSKGGRLEPAARWDYWPSWAWNIVSA
jgi:hypothetical protein